MRTKRDRKTVERDIFPHSDMPAGHMGHMGHGGVGGAVLPLSNTVFSPRACATAGHMSRDMSGTNPRDMGHSNETGQGQPGPEGRASPSRSLGQRRVPREVA